MTQDIFGFEFGKTIIFLVGINEFRLSQHVFFTIQLYWRLIRKKKTFRPLIGYVEQRRSFSFVKRKMRSSDSKTPLTAAEDPSVTLGQ